MPLEFRNRLAQAARAFKREPGEDDERSVIERHFDANYYLKNNPDVAAAGLNPLDHFLKHGWREGRSPTSDFDLKHYMEQNPEALSSSQNPFYGYLKFGRYHKNEELHQPFAQPDLEYQRSIVADKFDREYYIKNNPDVIEAGLDPLDHFLKAGWREGRNPNSNFNVFEYLEANLDVKEAKINAFYHYLLAGKTEGRSLRRRNLDERFLIDHAEPMQKRGAEHRKPYVNRAPMGRRELAQALDLLIPKFRNSIVISLSHDEYTMNHGGIQNCIRDEQRAANSSAVTYLHVAPGRPSLFFWPNAEAIDLITISIDGERVGHAIALDLIDHLRQRLETNATLRASLVIHSLLGHNVPFILNLYSNLPLHKSAVWIHDGSTLCTNFALLRNDVEFCGSPPAGSWSCKVCAYGRERTEHLQSVKTIFEALLPKVIFPSAAIRDLWLQRGYYPHGEVSVVPHGEPHFNGTRSPLNKSSKRLKVAFAGAAAHHKGWHIFSELVRSCAEDSRYVFLHLASQAGPEIEDVRFVQTSVTGDDRNAMVEALVREDVDIVLQWSLCFETFSFTTFEAILSGAFVLCRAGSGNAAVAVDLAKAGVLLSSKADLFEIFASAKIFKMVKEYRTKHVKIGHLHSSDSCLRTVLELD